MFKVSMTNLGREHATESAAFEHAPDGDDLYSMAKKHLYSGGIEFFVKYGNPDEGNYPVAGSVLAGAHHVGEFRIEEVAK